MNYKYNCLNPIADCGLKNLDASYVRTEKFEEADAVFVRSAKMDELKPGANLLAVARAGAGVNNIPHAEYAKQGIVVFNTPGANANGVKELVIAGMLLAEKSAKELRSYRRLPLVVLLRLIVVPLMMLCAVKLTHAALLTPNGETVLLVTMLAVSAPCASTVMQFCVMYGKSPDYAGAINIVSTLCCVASMPVMIALYQLW